MRDSNGGDGTPGIPSPTPEPEIDIILQVTPGAVLLNQDQITKTLAVHAFDSDGNEIPTNNLSIEWMSSNPDTVSVQPDPADSATATVTALSSIGTSMITARLRNDNSIVSPLVAVTRAKLHPEVELVSDDIVVFPPPDLPDGVDLSNFRLVDFTAADQGREARFGGFTETELANSLDITDEYEVRYPIVLRGDPPEVGQRLLASDGSPIAGTVLSAEQRGDFSLVQLRLGTPQELFEELEFDISAEKLIEDGLLMPFDTSEWESEDSNPTSGITESTGSTGKLASPLPQDVEFEIGSFLCKARFRPTFTQNPTGSNTFFGPIWDGSLRIGFFKIEHFFIKVGFQARAQFNPEIRLTKGRKVTVTCDTHPLKRADIEIPVGGPIAAFLNPYVEGLWTIPFTATLSEGDTSRYGMKLGFDYAVWTGGTYTSQDGWTPLCETWDQCSRTNADAELIWEQDTSGDQMTIEGDAALFGAAEGGIKAGGPILGVLDRIPGLSRILSGRIEALEKFRKVPILRLRAGPKAIIRWHNASRTAFFEASESDARVVLTGDVTLRFDALNSWLSTVLGFVNIRSFPLVTFPEGDLFTPYRVLNEETLTVNGEKVSSGLFTAPVKVGVGDTVSVVSTVEREFIDLTAMQLFRTRTTRHQEFPHLGEIWVDGKSIASMTPTNDFTLTGSFSATQELCDKAEATGGSVEVKLLAFNRMFNIIATSNFVGSFELTCAENLAPVVDSGEGQMVDLPDTATLSGTVTDDGIPDPPAETTVSWSKVSGPGTVVFANASAERTTATFSEAGVYVLELTASDGDLTSTDTVSITVEENEPPDVEAGEDQTITLPDSANLAGTVTVDDKTDPPGEITISWSKVSGPGTVVFGDASAEQTTATFSEAGVYVLELTASDGDLTSADAVTITVEEPVFSDVTGTWNTTYGTMELEQNGSTVTGTYATDNGVVIEATISGGILTGFWVEDSSRVDCGSAKDGRNFWGRISFEFNEDFTSFKGKWRWCNQDPTENWIGTRI